jgi:hypothetical protein
MGVVRLPFEPHVVPNPAFPYDTLTGGIILVLVGYPHNLGEKLPLWRSFGHLEGSRHERSIVELTIPVSRIRLFP